LYTEKETSNAEVQLVRDRYYQRRMGGESPLLYYVYFDL
jgi:hypothetical protein